MNKLLKIFGVLIAASGVNAQNLTLQQCIDYALLNQASYQNSNLDVEIAKAKIGEIRGIGLPQANFSGTLLDNVEVQKQFIPAKAFNPAAPEGLIQPLGFGVKYSSIATFSISQLIFDGTYVVGLQASQTFLELSKKSVAVVKADLVQNVKKAYLAVLVAEERQKTLEINIARLDSNYKQALASNKAGFVENIDLERLEVQVNNLNVELQKVQRFYTLALLTLKFQIGMPLTTEMKPSENLESYKTELNDINGEINYDNKPEFDLLKTLDRANRLELKSLKYGRLPSLAAFGNLGSSTGALDFQGIFKNTWYGYSNLGLSLNIPIFDGTQRYYKISGAKLKMAKTINDMNNLKNAIYTYSEAAKTSFQNNKKTLENQERTMSLSKKIVDVAQKKYQAGVGSSLEVINAESEYKTAVVNYYTTLYDCLVNKVEYDFAVGNLK